MTRADPADDPRRRLLIRSLTAGVLTGLFPGAACGQALFSSRPSRLPAEQSIYRLTGAVSVNDREADLRTRIQAGDTLETGADGELVFVVGGNAMILRGGSRLELTLPQAPRTSDSWLISGLRLLTGKVLSVSRRQPLRLETAVATIGIRGTGFYAESDPEETYLCTCYGETEIVANADPESRTTVTAQRHDRPLYVISGGAAGNNIRSAPFKNHSDQELVLIETLVGRTPPFGSTPYRRPDATYGYP